MFFSPSDSMAITLPSMNSERLMFPVSLTMLPALLLLFRRSDPARSTKLTLPNLLIVTPVAVGVRLDVDRHHGVRPRRVLVELMAANPAIPRAPRDDRERVVEARAVDGDEIGT